MEGKYSHMYKLLALDSCRPTLSQGLNQVEGETRSPLNMYEWKKALWCHPDGQFVQFVIDSLQSGHQLSVPVQSNFDTDQPQINHE